MSSAKTYTITGIIIMALLCEKVIKVQTHSCKIDTKEKAANCSGGALTEGTIPQDLGDILHLSISGNLLTAEVKETDFAKYVSLISLGMNQVKSSLVGKTLFHKEALRPLVKLEVLDTSGSVIPEDIVLPTTLRELSIVGCNFTQINVEHLDNLMDFNASENKLVGFPTFSDYAPLKRVDLSKNLLKSVTFEELAPFCLLHEFHFSFVNTSDSILAVSNWCRCKELWYWLTKYVNVTSGDQIHQCAGSPPDPTIVCQGTVETEALANLERKKCLLRYYDAFVMNQRIILGTIFLIVVLLLIAAGFAKPVRLPKLADTHPFETTPKSSDIAHSTTSTSPSPSPSPSPKRGGS